MTQPPDPWPIHRADHVRAADLIADELERQLADIQRRQDLPAILHRERGFVTLANPPAAAPEMMSVGVARRPDDGRVVLVVGTTTYDFDEATAYDLGTLLLQASGWGL